LVLADLSLLLMLALVAGGYFLFGLRGLLMARQVRTDEARRTYLCIFPREVAHDAVLNFVRAMSGLPKPKLFHRVHTVVFETFADAAGIKHYMSIPGHVVADVEGLLRTHVPGASLLAIEDTEDFIRLTEWDHVVELGMSNGAAPLHIVKPEAVVATILSHFSPLKDGQSVVLQWVTTPAKSQAPPTKSSDEKLPPWPWKPVDAAKRRDKLKEPTFIAIGRIAASGKDAKDLTQRVYGGLASTHAHGVHFTKRLGRQKNKQQRLKERTTALALPCQFNALELTALLGVPFGTPNVPGLPMGRARHLAPDSTIPSSGIVIGTSTFPGLHRTLALQPASLVTHTHIHGKNGVGKSTLMANIALQEMDQGYGVGIIDPHGDLIDDVLSRVPRHRLDDVILFDPTDTANPVGFNIFASDTSPEVLTDQIMAIFHGIYRDNGIYANNYLQAVIQTLASVPGMTLVEVPHFLNDAQFRGSVVKQLTDPVLKAVWHTYESSKGTMQAQYAAPAVHRVQPLLMRPTVRLTLGQNQSTIDMVQVLKERKILLVNVPKGRLGPETSALFGSLVFARMWQAAQSLSRIERYPYFLHLDEAQNFLNMPLGIDEVLAEARKYGLGLTLAHQLEAQLPMSLREAIHANTRTKLAFQVSAVDAVSVTKELGPPLTPVDLTSLGKYEVVMQATTENQTSSPATARTAPLPAETVSANALRAASRARWTRTAAEVVAEIAVRQTASRGGKPQAKSGWDVQEEAHE